MPVPPSSVLLFVGLVHHDLRVNYPNKEKTKIYLSYSRMLHIFDAIHTFNAQRIYSEQEQWGSHQGAVMHVLRRSQVIFFPNHSETRTVFTAWRLNTVIMT